MIVEDHRGGDGRQQPADRGLAPGLVIQGAVLGEVGDLADRRRRVNIDGALGAELIGAFKQLIENPVMMMV